VIGVQYRFLFLGLPPGDGHGKGVDDQLGVLPGGDRPADDLPGEDRHHRGAVQLAFAGGMLGDVGQPERVGPVRGEGAPDQVLLGRGVHQVLPAPAAVDALDTGLAHEPLDPLAVDLNAQAQPQLGGDPGRPVAPPRIGVDGRDQFQQLLIPALTR
jgi:hypothetical protein